MKTIFLFAFALLFLVSCKKRTEKISYPKTMSSCSNILEIDDFLASSTYIFHSEEHSFGAILGKKANLKIVVTNTSEQPNGNQAKPSWTLSYIDGWTVGNYSSDDTQTFTSNKSGEIVLRIKFDGINPGSCKMEFYENSSTVTKTTNLRWG